MFETILLLGIAITLLWNIVRRPKNFPPGPTVLPVEGIYPILSQMSPMESWVKFRKKYGDIVGFVLGQNRGLLVSGWESVRECLMNEDCQGRPDVCLIRDRFEGENYGVVFTEGEYWRTQRRFTLHHFRNLGFGRKSHESVIEDESLALVDEIGSYKGQPITLLDKVAVSVINTTWSLMGGCRYNHGDPIMKKLAEHIEESLHDIQVTGSIAIIFPLLRYIFPKSTGYASVTRGSRGVQEFTRAVIADHKKDFDPEKPRDLIDIYLNELVNNNRVKHPSFSEKQLEGLCMDLLSAGTDTTSNTVTFAIMFLCVHPEIQEKIHQELDEVLGKDRLPTIDDRPRLVYTDATLMETLRMRGPLPIMIPHKATRDTTLNGYTIPIETLILVDVYSVHMDETYWKDPHSFRPDRFVTEDGRLRKDERLIPFGKGKRSCLGETLARIMAFLFFSSLMQKYKFSFAPGVKVDDTRGDYGFTLAPPPFKVIATPRA